jgi:hypothetical protein
LAPSGGESGRTTAHLTNAMDDAIYVLEHVHGAEGARPHAVGGLHASQVHRPWNSAKKSWGCPCHGSRSDPYGKVLNGPAVTDLEKLET